MFENIQTIVQVGEDGSGLGWTGLLEQELTTEAILDRIGHDKAELLRGLDWDGVVMVIRKSEQDKETWDLLMVDSKNMTDRGQNIKVRTVEETIAEIESAIEEERTGGMAGRDW